MSLTPLKYSSVDYSFIRAGPTDKRSPCPALNTLANHGYLPRDGTRITFARLLHAVQTVYNLSMPLAFLLAAGGFLTCAKFTLCRPTFASPLPMSWTLSLADLAKRGWGKIAHDASLAHPSGVPSHAPDPALVADLVARASRLNPNGQPGLDFAALIAAHEARLQSLGHPLDSLHAQIAAGEVALTWLELQNDSTSVIQADTLEQWFGEERLPEGWWESRRPKKVVGLIETRRLANEVQSKDKDSI